MEISKHSVITVTNAKGKCAIYATKSVEPIVHW